jgi:hypothetical protein
MSLAALVLSSVCVESMLNLGVEGYVANEEQKLEIAWLYNKTTDRRPALRLK